MDELSSFYKLIAGKQFNKNLSLEDARELVKRINEFLYANYDGIGSTEALGTSYPYLSDFHKYWESYHKEILDCKINEDICEQVADVLHNLYVNTYGKAFQSVYNTQGLSLEEVCLVRFMSANQDFRGSRDFSELAKIYNDDNSIFDIAHIAAEPETFLKEIKVFNLGQSDKRVLYAQNAALFVLQHGGTPYNLINVFNGDIYALRKAIIGCESSGYGNKKTDMFLRDMVVLGVWNSVSNIEKLDVASDVNTIKVALRTGIISTAIPLVSSFLDIFCHQYTYIDEMNALAWRRVWEIWSMKYPAETVISPCMIDYYVYNVIGRQFCRKSLVIFECEKDHHTFAWHSVRNKTCQICYNASKKNRVSARIIRRLLPCSHPDGGIAIAQTDYAKTLPANNKITQCPFATICSDKKHLAPPKSISILGQTGWTSAYTKKEQGGGGLMA